MIPLLDIQTMRQEGLVTFQNAITERVRSGIKPDTDFIQKALLRAMGPIVRAIIGEDAKPEDHIRIHVISGQDPDGQLSNYTQAIGLTQMGNIVIESFMGLPYTAVA